MVYKNGIIRDKFRPRFTVTRRKLMIRYYTYHLKIRDVQLSDAGIYACTDDNGLGDVHVNTLNVRGNCTDSIVSPSSDRQHLSCDDCLG